MSQILTHCNVRSGSRLMVVESCNGLLLGAILERMAGINAALNTNFKAAVNPSFNTV